jgi:restriction endonuclease Mrr
VCVHPDSAIGRSFWFPAGELIWRRIISELQNLGATDFEQFCISFLGPLGYEQLQVTKRGADRGIDGHGLFRQGVVSIRSAFQAKRWRQNPVSRPEIDKFRGAIQGDYDHGVFLTTGRFTADAEAASIKKGAISLLLLDGDAIAESMIRNGIGVVRRPVQLFDLDPEFFSFRLRTAFFSRKIFWKDQRNTTPHLQGQLAVSEQRIENESETCQR